MNCGGRSVVAVAKLRYDAAPTSVLIDLERLCIEPHPHTPNEEIVRLPGVTSDNPLKRIHEAYV